jgi:hypothetical protein
MKVILKDKQYCSEFDLTSGQSYSFSSRIVNDINRFSVIFRTAGNTTGIGTTEKPNAQVFVYAANQITIIAPVESNYAIYNTVGQQIENGILDYKQHTINSKLNTGVYFVELSFNGHSEVNKVLIR